jgi:hypothetical protein
MPADETVRAGGRKRCAVVGGFPRETAGPGLRHLHPDVVGGLHMRLVNGAHRWI